MVSVIYGQGQHDIPEDELSLELLLLVPFELDESSDDEDVSSLLLLLLESESSEDDAGFFRFFLSRLAADSPSLPLLASLGNSSEAPRKRGLYCIKAPNRARQHLRNAMLYWTLYRSGSFGYASPFSGRPDSRRCMLDDHVIKQQSSCTICWLKSGTARVSR